VDCQLYYLRKRRNEVEEYNPFMTPKEKEIIGYLLKHNLKTFTADSDGGYAVTLLSREIARVAVIDGQIIDQRDVPVIIPDHIWDVLAAYKDQFPYVANDDDYDDAPAHPWRVPY
jgi:hypothetical protein